jgi:hypothetical protein
MSSIWRRWFAALKLRLALPSRRTGASRARARRLRAEQLEGRHLPSAYSDLVLSDGPVAYWRLDETAGLIAFDSNGHGANGFYSDGFKDFGQPGALLPVGDPDTADGFNGVNEFAQFANPVGGDFTVELWIKTTATSLTGGQAYQGNGLVWSDVGGVGNDWVLAVLNDRVAFFTGNPDDTICGTTKINDGNYHYIVATRVQGGEKRVYMDGHLEATGTTNNNLLNANPRVVVGANILDSRFFNGTIDEVALYPTALSATQVAAHFQAGHDRSPVAAADEATTDEAAPVAVHVLANDFDPDGDPLAITDVATPGHGTVAVNDNGTPADPTDDFVVYTPAADFTGTDQFVYTISDGKGGTATATVTVTVLNEAPQVDAGDNTTLNEGDTFGGVGRFTDPGSETWTATVNYGDGSGTLPLALNPDKTFSLSHVYADSGLYTVTVTVTDSHGGVGSGSLTVTVGNVSPTAAFTGPAQVPEGGAATVGFSGQFDPSSIDTAAGFHYAYDFDNDGTFDLGDGTYAGSTTAASAGVPASLLADGPTTRTVRGRIIDKDGGFSDYTTTVTVTNVAPVATLFNGGPVVEGDAGSVAFSNPSDPSPADVAAGFRYSFDFGDDGTFDVGDGASYVGSVDTPAVVVPASFFPDGPTTLVVRGRVFDKDGGFTEYTTTITVTNAVPTATLTNGGPVPEGSAGSVSFSNQSDPSPVDSAAGFRYAYDFDDDGTFEIGDGTYADSVGAASVTVPASYLADGAGSLTVRARVIDKDGGFTDYTTVIAITNVAPVAVFSGPVSVPEGGDATVTFGGQFDPSPVDTAAGFHYAYDFDGDGTFDLGDGTYAGSSTAAWADVPASLLADGPMTRIIRARVIDKDGGFTDYATTITVTSVAPVSVLSNGGPVVEGDAGSVAFSNPSDPSPADVAAGFRYSFDFGDDGTFDVGVGVSYLGSTTAASVTVPASFFPSAPGTLVVRGRVFDKDGAFTDYTTTITVTASGSNVAPTATLANGGPVAEGIPGSVSFSNQFDPSPADTAVGFHYAYDFDNDGTFEFGDGTYAGSVTAATAVVPAWYLDDGPGVRVVRARILDQGGAFTDYVTTITITNVAPTPAVNGPRDAVRGQTRTFTLTADDPSSADRAAGFTYLINWGDCSPTQTVGRTPGNGDGVTVDHVFKRCGTYTVRVTAIDKDGGSSVTTQTVRVTAVAMQPNPFDPTKTDLVIGGTTCDDDIRAQSNCDGTVRVLFGYTSLGNFAPTGRIVVYAQAGDDDVRVSENITLPAWLYGGDGNDRLTGGGGNNVLVGGDGNDRLTGGCARDLLIGGRGADRLNGNESGDLLISGTTAFDANPVALAAILAEWTSAHSFATRVANLSGTGDPATRLNGNYFLLNSGPGRTVFNDGATDVLTGGLGADWFFVGSLDWITDPTNSDRVSVV